MGQNFAVTLIKTLTLKDGKRQKKRVTITTSSHRAHHGTKDFLRGALESFHSPGSHSSVKEGIYDMFSKSLANFRGSNRYSCHY